LTVGFDKKQSNRLLQLLIDIALTSQPSLRLVNLINQMLSLLLEEQDAKYVHAHFPKLLQLISMLQK
jgi:hypothetical protein